MKWGLYDTVDHCWIGDDDGPKLFDSEDGVHKGDAEMAEVCARLAAELVDLRMEWPEHRTVHRVFDPGPLRVKDAVTPTLTNAEAFRRKLESIE